MKKRALSLILVLAMCFGILSLPVQAASSTVTELVAPKYDEVGKSSEGLVAVQLNGLWGFVDETGKEVVPCIYAGTSMWGDTYVPSFSYGLARVRIGTGKTSEWGYPIYKWGFINKTGKEIVPCKYDNAQDFSEGFAFVNADGKWGLINPTGKEVISCKYESAQSFSEGLAAVCINGKWGFIDTTGKEVIPCKYDYAFSFSEGLAAVQLDGKWGFINTSAKEVVSYKYDYARDFTNGFAAVCINGKYGFVDTTGKEIVPCKYDSAGDFREDRACVLISVEGFGFIDTNGIEVIPCKYGDAGIFVNGYAVVGINNVKDGICENCTLIDKNGKELIPPAQCSDARDFSEGHAAIADEHYRWGFIDTTGKKVIPYQYDNVRSFQSGLAAVNINANEYGNGGQWGLIDITGKEAVSCKYDDVKILSANLVAVKVDSKWGILSLDGATIPSTPATYTATPTNDALKVDGISQVPTAYKINGANYFQLRDVAMLLNGTNAQFSVDYDNQRKAVVITTRKAYTPLGTELAGATQSNVEAIPGNNDIYINGEKVDFTVYKINGANFFQIRTLGQALGFNVGWTKDTGMFIESDKPYDPNN